MENLTSLLVSKELHAQIKVHAALLGETIQSYTERALRRQLNEPPDHLPLRVLLESWTEYELEATK